MRTFVYDALGRLRSATNPESKTITYTYDGNGNVRTRISATGSVTMTYDHQNRVLSKTYGGTYGAVTPGVTYRYDGKAIAGSTGLCSGGGSAGPYGAGRLSMMQSGRGSSPVSSTSYVYDSLGRVSLSVQTMAGTPALPFQYTYNALDEVTQETYPTGRTVVTGYDNAGRLLNVNNAFTSTTYAGSAWYAANGAMSSLTLETNVTEATTFNSRFQPTQIQAGMMTLGYGYGTSNNNGNVQTATVTWAGNGTLNQYFVYDPMNRLLGALENPGSAPASAFAASFTCPAATGWCQQYGYPDVFGNRKVEAESSSLGALANVPTSFDPATNQNRGGNWTAGSYDDSGNVLSDGQTTYTYDAENRQVTGGGAVYVYDGDGRRVKKTAGGITSVYAYDAFGNLAVEYTSQVLVTETKYLTADALGSTRLVTNGSGTVQECRDYLPFGERLTVGRPGCATGDVVRQQFTGKERDSETDLDYFGARYMSSAQGRVTSVDPVFATASLFTPQSWNGYSYALNNPLKYVDRDGDFPINLITGAVGALPGAAVGAAGEYVNQLSESGQVTSGARIWTAAGGGALAGGIAGFTLGIGRVLARQRVRWRLGS